jgi:hypothetical protein
MRRLARGASVVIAFTLLMGIAHLIGDRARTG